jgi:heptosyltransferase-2
MNILILKLGATGDVVRTTPLLRRLDGEVTWITAAKNTVLLQNLGLRLRCFSWEQRESARDRSYDLVINLEDDLDSSLFVKSLKVGKLFGAYTADGNALRYTDDSRKWFDLSLISVFGKKEADRLKLLNRSTYQALIFEGLGMRFNGEQYLLPEPKQTPLAGDVALAPEAGPVWPMKNWAYFKRLKEELENRGFTVNVLPVRPSLLEHLADVRNHRCLVSGDSLPMHFGLGQGVKCVSLFTCTSPWEIYEYGLQKKILSPLLEQFFYKRDFDVKATTAISFEEVFEAVMGEVGAAVEK